MKFNKLKTHHFRQSFFIPAIVWGVALSFLFISNSHFISPAGAEPAAVKMIPGSFTQLAKATSPAVVNISTVKTMKTGGRVFEHLFKWPEGQKNPFEKFFGQHPRREFKQQSLGSGFVLDKDGYIVTNNHVIEDADEIKVILNDGQEFDAKIIGTDVTTDLALIKIKSDKNLPVLELGDSDKLDIGQWVIAIGNPFGLDHTVTAGIVSAKGRVIGAGPYDDFIQTDASINPGNSGGPLINMSGRVVGINTAIIAGGDGIGFAIPINMAKKIINQLKKNGEVTRGWLGVGIQDLDKELKEYYGVKKGVLITEVFPDDPADKAGIKPKDIVQSINGNDVNSARDLSALVAGLIVDEKVKVKISRDGKSITISVVIAKREDSKLSSLNRKPSQLKDELGIEVSSITPEIAKELRLSDTQGVVVIDMDSEGKGVVAGIKTGDIIKEVNHIAIETVEEYHDAIKKVKTGDMVQLYIKRSFKGYVVIKLTK